MGPDPKVLQEFFFEAALMTYAGGAVKTTVPGLPKSKMYQYERGNLLYVDTYWTNGEYSGGKTLIYEDFQPVWMMDYDGWCKNDDPAVISYLKRALTAAYTAQRFCGGRGPGCLLTYEDNPEGFKYENRFDPAHFGFRYFQGRERIVRLADQKTELFWHRYKGLVLFGDVNENTSITL